MKRIMAALVLVLLASGVQAQQIGGGGGIFSSVKSPRWDGSKWNFDGQIVATDGSVSAAAIALASDLDTGPSRYGDGTWRFLSNGTTSMLWGGLGNLYLLSNSAKVFFGASSDTVLQWDASGRVGLKNGNNDQGLRIYGANGGYWESAAISELVTIAAAASTDSTGDLLPADAVIESVVLRVVTAIPTAATFTVGDATTAARFATGVSTALSTTAVGLAHRQPDVAAAAGPVQSSAAKIRITPNASPAAATGQVRIDVFYSKWVAPTT